MKSLIGDWVGKDVAVMLRLGGGTSKLKSKLLQGEQYGIKLEMPAGRTFVPITAILDITQPE